MWIYSNLLLTVSTFTWLNKSNTIIWIKHCHLLRLYYPTQINKFLITVDYMEHVSDYSSLPGYVTVAHSPLRFGLSATEQQFNPASFPGFTCLLLHISSPANPLLIPQVPLRSAPGSNGGLYVTESRVYRILQVWIWLINFSLMLQCHPQWGGTLALRFPPVVIVFYIHPDFRSKLVPPWRHGFKVKESGVNLHSETEPFLLHLRNHLKNWH